MATVVDVIKQHDFTWALGRVATLIRLFPTPITLYWL